MTPKPDAKRTYSSTKRADAIASTSPVGLTIWTATLIPTHLLLSKLQFVETNEKDRKDAPPLVADHDLRRHRIALDRITEVGARDGWSRTIEMIGDGTAMIADKWAPGDGNPGGVSEKLRRLTDALSEAPKSPRRRMRTRIGDRIRRHKKPVEIGHSSSCR